MAIRLQDIADDLNLSKMTISKVLRGQTDISAETKARVLKRLQELNYRPNISARGLKTGQTFTIGLAVPDLIDPSVAQIAAGVNEAVQPDGYSVVITSANGDPEREEREVELQLSRQVDALLLLLRADSSDVPTVLESSRIPVAVLGHAPPRFAGISVGVNENEVGELAARHLIERRCKRIAYFRGPRTPVGDFRFSGFLEVMRKSGLQIKQEWIVESYPGGASYRSGYEGMQRLLKSRNLPEGVIAFSDPQAIGIRAAAAAGPGFPGRLQIVGCGNSWQADEMQITSIDLPYREVGRRAARLLLRMLADKEKVGAPRSVLLSPSVVQRGSTQASSPERKGKRQ